jgi:hypothetical protein
LTKQFPKLCPAIANESAVINAVNCERLYEDSTIAQLVKKADLK